MLPYLIKTPFLNPALVSQKAKIRYSEEKYYSNPHVTLFHSCIRQGRCVRQNKSQASSMKKSNLGLR